MKLLHAMHSADPATGGPVEGVSQLARANAEAGHEVQVISLDDPGAPWVPTIPFQLLPLGPGVGQYGFRWRFKQWLEKEARRFDAVIVNGVWQFHGLAVRQACLPSRVPYFVFPHGMLDPWFGKTYPLKHLKKILYWLPFERRILRDARRVFFTCDQERILARSSFPFYACREAVITYGTAAPPAGAANSVGNLLQLFPKLRDKRIVLFLGRLHPKKGCDLLIRAFADFLQSAGTDRTRHFHLVMAGPDQKSWQKSLMTLAAELGISERITWTGMLQGNMKWAALALAEVFVLPSHQENFGIAVVEALGSGVPVLITKEVNIWREIEADGAGWSSPDNPEGVHQLLERWLAVPEEQRRQMRARARDCFYRRFEIRRAAQTLVQSLLDSGVKDSHAARAVDGSAAEQAKELNR